jgi:hypothetical protein
MRESANKSKNSVWSLAKFVEMTKGGSLPADNFPPNRPSNSKNANSFSKRTI